MMKYIRTKDGFITLPYNEMEWGKLPQEQTGGLSYEKWFEIATSELKIIAEADTIEELCDEFVVVNNTCFNMPQLLGTKIDKDYYKHEDVYGAIWTDKGLIYVAKLNDKGDLVLI